MKRTFLNSLIIVLLLLWLPGCTRQPPEQRLRDTLNTMQSAVEAGKAADFMRPVAADFVGNQAMDRDDLERMLRAQLLINRRVGVHTGPLAIEINGDTAVVTFSVALTGGQGRGLPERGQLQSIRSGWRQVDGQWQLYYAHWHPSSGSAEAGR